MQLESTSPIVEIFCCYAREDLPLFHYLEKHLAALRREGLATLWADIYIPAGTSWEGTIHHHLDTAQIVLLLISPDFLNSDACFHEMGRALMREQHGEARVIPILLRPVDWEKTPFRKLQMLPQEARPIESAHWLNRDEALAEVTRGIRRVIMALLAEQERCQTAPPGSGARKQQMKDPHIPSVSSSELSTAQLVQATSTLANATSDLAETPPAMLGAAATTSISRMSPSSTRPITIVAGSVSRSSQVPRPSITALPVMPPASHPRGKRRKRFLSLILFFVALLAGVVLIIPPWQIQKPSGTPGSGYQSQTAIVSHSASPTTSSTPTSTSTPTSLLPSTSPPFTFEDGTKDGWDNTNGLKVTECTVSNSREFGVYDSAHALKVVIRINDLEAMPTATVSVKNGPMVGHTISAWLYVPPMQKSTIKAKLFVRDSGKVWRETNQKSSTLPGNGSWFHLSEAISSYSGQAILVGVQFHVYSLNTDLVVYIDNIDWT
jgi:hypothetical protein